MYIDGVLDGTDKEKHKVSGLPTLLFTACSVVKDSRKCVTMDAKKPGDLVYMLGGTKDELGGSEYYEMLGHTGLNVPQVNFKELIPMYEALQTAIEQGLVASAHGVYRGGLGVHLAQVAFASGLGLDIDLSEISELDNTKLLYSESAGRFIVTISPENKEKFENLFKGMKTVQIGVVIEELELLVKNSDKILIQKQVQKLKEVWKA